jgi:hypothetical protein
MEAPKLKEAAQFMMADKIEYACNVWIEKFGVTTIATNLISKQKLLL